MSKTFVRIISVFMLVGFLGFLVPINSWHALVHPHKTTHLTDHSGELTFKQGIEKCAFCDLQLPLLFHQLSRVEIFIKVSFDFLFTDYCCFELPVKNTCLFLRGPPIDE